MRLSLVCPTCGDAFGDVERFCPRCGVPLVRSDADPDAAGERPSARRARARKIKPQYAEGTLVRVARAQHQAEAELIQNLLLEEGIPSMTRRSGGFDVPDFLAAGPRDVLVPQSGAEAARDVLSGGGDAREM
jgi:Putative prokaryotic signal transducing protein